MPAQVTQHFDTFCTTVTHCDLELTNCKHVSLSNCQSQTCHTLEKQISRLVPDCGNQKPKRGNRVILGAFRDLLGARVTNESLTVSLTTRCG